MHKKHFLVILGVLTAVAAGTAMAAPPPPAGLKPEAPTTKAQRVTWSCPPMISPDITTVQTDWLLDSPQGWLDHGEIAKGDTVSMLRCYYGIDKNNPATRPAFFIHRVIPAGYTHCALGGPSNTLLTCESR